MSRPVTAILVTALLATACSDSSDAPAPPPAPLQARYVLGSADSVPEGIAFDPVERAFYATSLQGGSITRIAADGTESLFRPADNRARLGGAKVDPAARRLWVCAQQVDGLDNRVWVFDLDDAELAQEFLLGALSSGGSCNDLALDDSGVAYVTDPANPYIYRLDPATGEGEVAVTDPQFQDVSGVGLGLNGIVVAPGGATLIVGKFIPPGLLRVDLAGGAVQPVALSGDSLPNPDGLVLLGGDVFAVGDASVSRVRLDGALASGTVVTVPQTSGLSTATVAADALYVIKSEVVSFVLGQPLDLPFEIFRVDPAAFGP